MLAPRCPSRVVLNRIGARWTIFVVVALEHETHEVRRTEVLHQRHHRQGPDRDVSRALEHDGLVLRVALPGTPPSVEYSLTPLGRSLLIPLAAVRDWAETHVPDVLGGQRRGRPLGEAELTHQGLVVLDVPVVGDAARPIR